MINWRQCKLGDICDTISERFRTNKDEVVLINTSDVFDGKVTNHSFSENKNLAGQFKKAFRKDDILYSEIRPQNRRFGYVDFDSTDYVASTKLMVLRNRPDQVVPKYLFQLLKSDSVIDELQLIAETRSGTFPQITFTELASLSILLPPIQTQYVIAEVLSSLDEKIDQLTQQNSTLDALVQTYFRQWFLEENMNDSISVLEVATLENNSVNPSRHPLEPYYHYSIPAFDNDQTPSVELGKAILSNKFSVLPDSILVSKLNPVTPRVWRIDENVQPNSVCSTEFQVLKPKNKKHNLFLYCLMKSNDVVSSFAMSATGTSGSHQRIRPEYILEVEMPAPDDDKLALFNEVCNPLMERVKKNQIQIKTLRKLRDTLLPKLLSGEVRVKEMGVSANA